MPSRRPVSLTAAALSAAALLALSLVAPRSTLGQMGGGAYAAPSLSGHFRYAGNPAQGQQIIDSAVRPAIAGMPPDMRRMARNRIAESTWLPTTIEIQASPDRIRITFQGAEQRTFDTAPGQPANIYSRSGVRAQLVQTFRPDGGIQQRLRTLDGVQVNILRAAGPGMVLDVLMQSPRLARDVRFQLQYAR